MGSKPRGLDELTGRANNGAAGCVRDRGDIDRATARGVCPFSIIFAAR